MSSRVYSVDDLTFSLLIKESNSYSDCLRKLGLSTNGGSCVRLLKKRINDLKCDTSHFNKSAGNGGPTVYALEDILIENSTYYNIASLKRRLIKSGLISYQCDVCGLTAWQNKPLSLHLDHINGIHNDHRLENLRFLCPNCHSQTTTYAGKNINLK